MAQAHPFKSLSLNVKPGTSVFQAGGSGGVLYPPSNQPVLPT
jgi:hypothetical protein